jgi:hypothetical protein
LFASPTGTRKLRCSDRARLTFGECQGSAHLPRSTVSRRRRSRRLHLFHYRQTPQAVPAFRSRGCSRSSPRRARDAARSQSASSPASRPGERFQSPAALGFVRAVRGSSGRRPARWFPAASSPPTSAANACASSRLPLLAHRASSSSRRVGTTSQNFSGPEARLPRVPRAAPVGRSRRDGGDAVRRGGRFCASTRSSWRLGRVARISFTRTS